MPPLPLAWASADNPVYRSEIGRWRRSRFWRRLNSRLWGLALFLCLVLVCAPVACAGSLAFWPRLNGPAGSPEADIFLVGMLLALVSSALASLANWLLGLVAMALSATLIARDRESQAWPLVRLTPLTSRQIVGGKLRAFLYALQNYMHLIAIWRGLTLVGGTLAFVLFTLLSPDMRSSVGQWLTLGPLSSGLTVAEWGLVGLVAAAAWLAEPYFSVLYNGAVGLAVSTFARTRRWAIALAFITQFTLGLALYWPVQQVAAFLPFLLGAWLEAAFPTFRLDPTQLMLPTLGLQWGTVWGLQVAVLAGSLALAVSRVEQLSE